jgi:putative acetyltransferase
MVQATFMLTLRGETPEDIPAIHHINTAAFGGPNEADLVDALQQHNALTISLVAVLDGRLVGHIAFSLVTITSETGTIEALGLAPIAVLPAYQRRGIGSQLVEAGLTAGHYTPYGVVVGPGTSALLPSLRLCTSQARGHCVGA